MTIEIPCTACSWSIQRQKCGSYTSNVKLEFNAGDRAVWSLGPKYIFKDRSTEPPSFEARNLNFLKENTTIPIPTFVLDYEENCRYFMQTERIPGASLETVWTSLSAAEKENIAKQTADALTQLRTLTSPRMQCLDGQPLYSSFLFLGKTDCPHGPLSSDDELWTELSPCLKNLPEELRLRFRKRMPTAEPFTFTHGDLAAVNIMVKDGNLTGIIDWESSGYFPVWWEFAGLGIGLGENDGEWKALLRKHMPQHEAAREFWRDLYYLRDYPKLYERGEEALARLQIDG